MSEKYTVGLLPNRIAASNFEVFFICKYTRMIRLWITVSFFAWFLRSQLKIFTVIVLNYHQIQHILLLVVLQLSVYCTDS